MYRPKITIITAVDNRFDKIEQCIPTTVYLSTSGADRNFVYWQWKTAFTSDYFEVAA